MEFVCRMVLSGTILLLIFYGAIAYARSLPVSDLDLIGLSGRLPGTIGKAIAHIFAGSGPTFVRISLVVALGIAVLWWAVTTISRSVTMATFSRRLENPLFAAVGRANALRIGLWLLAIAAFVGSYVFAAHRAQLPERIVDPRIFALYFFSLAAVTVWIALLFDWLFTLKPVVAFREPNHSLFETAQIAFEHKSQFVWVHFALGLVRFAIFWLGVFAFFVLLSLAMELPPAAAWLLIGAFVVAIVAVTSLLQVLRLAAYARIVEWTASLQA
jgi:hypothetical protein